MSSSMILQEIRDATSPSELLPLLKDLRTADNSKFRSAEARDVVLDAANRHNHSLISTPETAFWFAKFFSWFATPAEGQALCAGSGGNNTTTTSGLRSAFLHIILSGNGNLVATPENARMVCIAINNIACNEDACDGIFGNNNSNSNNNTINTSSSSSASSIHEALIFLARSSSQSAAATDVWCRAVNQICSSSTAARNIFFSTPGMSRTLSRVVARVGILQQSFRNDNNNNSNTNNAGQSAASHFRDLVATILGEKLLEDDIQGEIEINNNNNINSTSTSSSSSNASCYIDFATPELWKSLLEIAAMFLPTPEEQAEFINEELRRIFDFSLILIAKHEPTTVMMPMALHHPQMMQQKSPTGDVEVSQVAANTNTTTTATTTYPNILREFLESGLSVHATDTGTKGKGNQLIHLACTVSFTTTTNKEYKLNVLRVLLQHGANIFALNENKDTPLHLACASGSSDLVSCLVQHIQQLHSHQQGQGRGSVSSVFLYMRNANGQTPRDVALAAALQHQQQYNTSNNINRNHNNQQHQQQQQQQHAAIIKLLDGVFASSSSAASSSSVVSASSIVNSASGNNQHMFQQQQQQLHPPVLNTNSNNTNNNNNLTVFLPFLQQQQHNTRTSSSSTSSAHHHHHHQQQPIINPTLNDPVYEKNGGDASQTARQMKIFDLVSKGKTRLFAKLDASSEFGPISVDEPLKDRAKMIHVACQWEQLEFAELLLRKGAVVSALDGQGQQPLHRCAAWNRVDSCRWLTERGADVNALDHQNRSALMYAALYGHCKVAEFLLGCGAVVDLKDANGKTAAVLAEERGNRRVSRLLMESAFNNNNSTSPTATAATSSSSKTDPTTIAAATTDSSSSKNNNNESSSNSNSNSHSNNSHHHRPAAISSSTSKTTTGPAPTIPSSMVPPKVSSVRINTDIENNTTNNDNSSSDNTTSTTSHSNSKKQKNSSSSGSGGSGTSSSPLMNRSSSSSSTPLTPNAAAGRRLLKLANNGYHEVLRDLICPKNNNNNNNNVGGADQQQVSSSALVTVDVNYQDPETKKTALHAACAAGNYSNVEVLLQCNADATLRNADGETAREVAVRIGRRKVLEILDAWDLKKEEEGSNNNNNNTAATCSGQLATAVVRNNNNMELNPTSFRLMQEQNEALRVQNLKLQAENEELKKRLSSLLQNKNTNSNSNNNNDDE